MNGKVLFGFAMFWLLGIFTGWTFSKMAYSPMLVSQGREIYKLENDKLGLIERYKFLEVEIEAHSQDMEQFIDKSTLIQVLKQLGIVE